MNKTLRVLIIEDIADDAELMLLRLEEEGFEPLWQRVETESDYLKALKTPPELILADWYLPQFSGLRALKLMRESHLDIPFIIVSGSIAEEAAVDALRNGAYDYVLKDRLKGLGKAVLHGLEEKQTRDAKGRAESNLRESEARFRRLAENAPDIVARFDRDLRHLYINPVIEKYMGISQEEFIGRTCAELGMLTESLGLWENSLQETFRIGRGTEIYFSQTTQEGRKHFHSHIVPEFDEDGSVETILAITRDITILKKMEAVLQQELYKTRLLHLRSLPDDLPETGGLSLATHYQPSVELRGDYYNVIRHGDQLLLYLVDIEEASDDGVMQSLYVRKMIDYYLSTHVDNAQISASGLLRYLVERYHFENEREMCSLCVFIAVFDISKVDRNYENNSIIAPVSNNQRKMRYACTGFCTPPLVISVSAETGGLSMEKLYLAPNDGTSSLKDYKEYSFKVEPGSIFLFSTDGLIKQCSDKGTYEPRLREVLSRHAHLPPELISRAIDEDCAEFCSDSLLNDDIAFVVVQSPEQQQSLYFKLESDLGLVSKAIEKTSSFLAIQLGQQLELLDFYEMLVNAIEHGNKQDGGKTVSVNITVTNRYYKIVITDQGDGFDWRKRINRDLDLTGDSDRGRGIIMTRMLTDYLGYNERGNRVTIINLLA